jgi:hypothetical protein
MSAPLRRSLLRNVGARIGLTISEWGDSALPSFDEPVNHEAAHAMGAPRLADPARHHNEPM